MKSSDFVCFHELDFVLPVHRFHINFSYTDAQRLSFIREFFLRVINVSPQQPKDLAQFFALTKRELSEALSDLVASGDLHYRDDGYVELTTQSKAYFSGLASIPKVQKIDESHGHFNFELSDMNYLGHEKINENWKFALRLSIDNEIKSRSELQAKKAFQFNFQDIIDKGGIKGVGENDDKSINLYNVSDVRKVTEQPLRISHQFTISKDGNHLERGDIEALKNSSKATAFVTEAIEQFRQTKNYLEIFRVIDQFKDDNSKNYITDDGLDISRILADQRYSESRGNKVVPLLGIIYTPENWLKVAEILENNFKQSSNKASSNYAELIWLAPANPYWGKSEKTFSCLKYIIERSSTSGKKGKKLYQPQLYLPIERDDSGRSRTNWNREFQGISEKALSGYTGDFCSGNVEVIIHTDLFAVVSYHLTAPDMSPVPVPFGFITQDKDQIRHIHSQVVNFLSETDRGTGKARNIGLLKAN